MRVFVTGGSGLVGSRLKTRLLERGDEVVILTRRPEAIPAQAGVTAVAGDPTQPGPWMSAIHSCDAVVNLVGEGIFNKRWNAAFKEALVKSRVDSTRNVVQAMKASPKRADGTPKVLVSASAIGIYGPHDDEKLTESSPAGDDFLAKLCVDWEKAAIDAESAGVRVVILRVGVVLDAAGGALAKMLPPFKMFVGGPVGSGKQYMSWIHHEDLVGQIVFALDHSEFTGPMNGAAPNPVTNAEFSKALGKVLGRPSFLPTPAIALRVAMGEVANVVTKGQRVLPARSIEAGYSFRFAEIEPALRDVLASK